MTFQNQLNDYILQAKCSSKELAAASGLSEGTISRYRKGYRVPGVGSEQLINLAAGLYALLSAQDAGLTENEIFDSLSSTIDSGISIDYSTFITKLKQLLRIFEISNNELGRKLNYDPSYISRILSGQRRPADIRKFTDDVAAYIALQKADEFRPTSLAAFLECDEQAISTSGGLQKVITAWLCSD